MSAEEQLERMKRHQRALVRDRQRNLSQGPYSSSSPPQRCSSRTSWNQGQEPPPSVCYPHTTLGPSGHRDRPHHRRYATLQPSTT